jgi:hypothetical protein
VSDNGLPAGSHDWPKTAAQKNLRKKQIDGRFAFTSSEPTNEENKTNEENIMSSNGTTKPQSSKPANRTKCIVLIP